MKLLEAVKRVNWDERDLLTDINEALLERLDWLSDREPNSCGEVYDKWDTQYNYVADAQECFEEAVDGLEELQELEEKHSETQTINQLKKKIIEDIKQGARHVLMCQSDCGGLSRLKI